MGKDDLSTLQNILRAGKKEFLEKGFRAASLRNIVKEAGVTTGAFYGYFDSKEALFRALVDEAARTCIGDFQNVQDAFAALTPEEQAKQLGEASGVFLDWMVDYIYEHFDAFKLLLCCSSGTEYEDFVHEMVEIEEEGTRRFRETMKSAGVAIKELDGQLEHILISGMFSGFFEIVIHDMPKEKSQRYIRELREFYTAGWMKIMGF